MMGVVTYSCSKQPVASSMQLNIKFVLNTKQTFKFSKYANQQSLNVFNLIIWTSKYLGY